MHHLLASSRAPTYAGTLERRLRGWSRKPPTEDELGIVVILGGMERMAGKSFSLMRGTYNARLEVLGGFVDQVSSAARSSSEARVSHVEKIKDVMDTLDTPFDFITEAVLDSLPHVDDFLVMDFQRRILEEDLLDGVGGAGRVGGVRVEADESELGMERQRELASPFGYVRRLMAEVDEGERSDGMGSESNR